MSTHVSFRNFELTRLPLVFLMALSLGGCAGGYAAYMTDSLLDPPSVAVVSELTGESLELFAIDTEPNPRQALFFVSGSGCTSLRYFMRDYFRGLTGSYRIYAVQKPGVAQMDAGWNCSHAFLDRYTHDELVRRNREALRWVQSQWPGTLAGAIGVSEGGNIAAQLAAENPSIGKLLVIGSGGMPFRQVAQLLARKRNMTAQVDAALVQIDADPSNAQTLVFGMTPRYWSSVLDNDPADIYRRVKQPILLIVGEKDENVPVESAYFLRDQLRATGASRFMLEVVPGANHFLVRDGRDLKPEIMQRISLWLDRSS